MKINEIRLTGWRSYSDEEEVSLKNLKHINIIIGPNNSGKSNIFKYLFYLREIGRKARTAMGTSGKEYGLYNKISEAFPIQNTWAESSCDVIGNIRLEEIDQEWSEEDIPTLHQKDGTVSLCATHRTNDNSSCLSVKYEEHSLLEEFQDKPNLLNIGTKKYVNPMQNMDYFYDTYQYWNVFLDSLYFVDAIRHHNRTSSSQKESDVDGSEIVKEIIRIRNEEDRTWRDFKKQLENWLRKILGESQLELDPVEDELRFYIQRGEKEISAYLSQLGTGVSQLVMLLSFLYLNKDRTLNVFIEEPEGNLHPEAVVQLVNIIQQNFKNHRFFITTHSSVLIDQVDDDWNVHRVVRKENQSSILYPCTEVVEKYEVLDQLGIKASQLLQSNLVIWIEGPSDRTYINKWIKDNTPQGLEFIEGRHYSFLMYGGANLTTFDVLAANEYIDILKTSRYAILVCDSDKNYEEDNYKERVQKFIDRISELDIDEPGHEKKLSDYVYIWITKGREIENYVPHDLFISVLQKEAFLRKYVYVGTGDEKVRKEISFNLDQNSGEPFQKYDAFDKYFAEKYTFMDSSLLGTHEKSKIASDYSRKKAAIAKALTEEWKMEDYKMYDIQEQMAKVIQHIKCANGM
ncbi:ATP-binding protein [Bacillus sp. SI2]|uniref:ATP-dependent nuclease n=1 Tax=Bacillus sp. SI2 TaxID=3077323 RepID=UPI0028EE96F0|nr:ATP-binding protein [Bacillus sp. SI2]WNV20006.1 ATP-binding protein [Bacillus sp. SI2]